MAGACFTIAEMIKVPDVFAVVEVPAVVAAIEVVIAVEVCSGSDMTEAVRLKTTVKAMKLMF